MNFTIFTKFHYFNENNEISLKSTIFIKIAKIAYFPKVHHLFRTITISGGENVELQQHFQPGAGNEHISTIFTKITKFRHFT